jgi:predicted PurR-regulated permease PerM
MDMQELIGFSQVTREKVERVTEEFNEYQRKMNGNLEKIYEKIDILADKIEKTNEKLSEVLLARPSWSVTAMITFLTTVCGCLLTFVLTK